jgi:hypothetical protein
MPIVLPQCFAARLWQKLHFIRPHVEAMDSLNQAIDDLAAPSVRSMPWIRI